MNPLHTVTLDDCTTYPWNAGNLRCPMDDGYAHICNMDADHDGACYCGCGSMKDKQDDAYFCERCGESTANQARFCPTHRVTYLPNGTPDDPSIVIHNERVTL